MNTFNAILSTVLVLLLITWAVLSAVKTPDVEFSYASKQCVAVIYYDGSKGDCANIPEKYNRVWVK